MEELVLDEIADTDRKDQGVLDGMARTATNPRQAEAHEQYRQAHEKFESARNGYNGALSKYRHARAGLLQLYAIYHTCAGLPGKSVQACREGLLICPESMRAGFEALLAMNLAQVCLDDQVEQHAKVTLESQLKGGFMPLALDKATALQALCDIKDRQMSAANNPQSKQLIAAELVQLRQKAVAVDPDANSKAALAYTLAQVGRSQEAAAEMTEALKLFQSNQNPHSTESADVRQAKAGFQLRYSSYLMESRQYEAAAKQASLAAENFWASSDIAEAKLIKAGALLKVGDRKTALELMDSTKDALRNCPSLQLQAKKLVPEFKLTDKIGEKWALIVGISNFADSAVPKLRYCSKDATDIKDFLTQKANFKPDHIKVLLNEEATRANILHNLDSGWIKNVGPDDLVFFFISSHGTPSIKDPNALNYLVAYDTTKEHFFSEGIPMRRVSQLLAEPPGLHSFVVVDTCYSGGVSGDGRTSAQSNVDQLLFSPRQIAVCSSSSNERSWESTRYPNGIFTRQLINALTAAPAYDNFKTVFGKVKSSVTTEVAAQSNAKQTPTMAGLWNGVGLIGQGGAR